MTRLLLAIFLLVTTLNASAQCDAPEIVSWAFNSEDDFQVTFIAPEASSSYSLSVLNPGMTSTHTGVVSGTNNTISIDLGVSESSLELYFEFELIVLCDDIQSAPTHFYATFYSLYNQQGISCTGNYFEPLLNISDNTTIVAEYLVPIETVVESVTSITVLIELYHTWNGDLTISLESPSGTEINLLQGSFGSSDGLSVLFDASGPPISSQDFVTPQGSIMGIMAPAESFDVFYGEPVSGNWKVKVSDNIGGDVGKLYSVCLSFGTTPCTVSISGNVYYDLNSNNFHDDTEPVYTSAVLSNSLTPFPFFNWNDGTYLRCSPEGEMELSILNTPNYYNSNPENYNETLVSGAVIEDLDFALQPIPGIVDLTIDLWTTNNLIPGFQAVYHIDYANIGTECQDEVEIEVLIDPILNILSTSAVNYTQNNNILLLNLGNLCPFESGSFTITVIVPDTVSLGVSVDCFAEVNPFEGDEDTSNNQDELRINVIGSFDPNDKQVNYEIIYPDFQEDQKYLEYLIRFQNTGTFYAQNVVVTDTLSAHLNPATFVLLNNSHPVEVLYEDNALHFNFNDIMLPDSTTNEPESHGYVRFKIKPYQNIELGTVIENTANIYFDFNEPIITNTTQTFYTLITNLSSTAEGLEINIYPNPARDQITVVWGGFKPQWIEIMDVSGRVVLQNNLSQVEEQTVLNVASMPAGLYFLRLSSAAEQSISKWIKQ